MRLVDFFRGKNNNLFRDTYYGRMDLAKFFLIRWNRCDFQDSFARDGIFVDGYKISIKLSADNKVRTYLHEYMEDIHKLPVNSRDHMCDKGISYFFSFKLPSKKISLGRDAHRCALALHNIFSVGIVRKI